MRILCWARHTRCPPHRAGHGGEAQFPRRQIYQTYLVVPQKVKPQKIIGRIEAMMDKLKLDMSYSVPEVSPVNCSSE